jgi:hypothetical protein
VHPVPGTIKKCPFHPESLVLARRQKFLASCDIVMVVALERLDK